MIKWFKQPEAEYKILQWAESLPGTPEYVQHIPCKAFLVANAMLLLINSATYLLRCQIKSKADRFLEEGGFSERMSQKRREMRK